MINVQLVNGQLIHINEWVTYILTQDQVDDIWNDADFSYVNWEIVINSVPDDYIRRELTPKVQRLSALRQEIRSYWGNVNQLTHTKLDQVEADYVATLQTEFTTLEADIDNNYDPTLSDSIFDSLYPNG